MHKVCVVDSLPKNSLGEGPLWDKGKFYYIDIVEQKIHRYNPKTKQHDVLPTRAPVGFAVLDQDGGVVAGLGNGSLYRLGFGSTRRELLARAVRDNPDNLANDGKCDRQGRLWFGTKNKDECAPDSGSLCRLDAGGKLTEILHPVHISNGLAWSPDNKKMYYNDSTDKIWVMDYNLKTGKATDRRNFVELTKDGAVPDGMTIDSCGRLYCAMWGGSRVDVYAPDGQREETIKVPTALQISSVAFGGDDLKTLFITSAAVGLSPAQQRKYPDSGRIFTIRRSVPGLPETRFDNRNLIPSQARP